MPKIRIDQEKLMVARILESLGWTHNRIGSVFGVGHSTITHALRDRKTCLPQRVDEIQLAPVALVLDRIDKASRQAVASELRIIADEMQRA